MLNDSSSNQLKWRPLGDWGIIASLAVAILALFGPPFVLQPAADVLMPLLPISNNLKVALATSAVAILSVGVVAASLVVFGKNFRAIGLNKPRAVYAGKALLALVAYIAVSLLVQLAARQFFGLNVDEPQQLGYQGLTNELELMVAFLVLVLLVPVAEELLFRGFIFAGFRRRLPFWLAAIAVSALFGLIHGQWNVGLDVFVMSLVACYLVEKTKSLWPAIFLHLFKNAVAFYLVYLYNG